MQLLITPDGTIRAVYSEDVDLATLGSVATQRGSHVEPDEQNQWWVDLSPVNGPRIGPFPFACRNQALDAEREWLEQHWLMSPQQVHHSGDHGPAGTLPNIPPSR